MLDLSARVIRWSACAGNTSPFVLRSMTHPVHELKPVDTWAGHHSFTQDKFEDTPDCSVHPAYYLLFLLDFSETHQVRVTYFISTSIIYLTAMFMKYALLGFLLRILCSNLLATI